MSSGHTGRSGRGNRRARRGPQRQRGPEGQNGQPRQNTAMLLVSQPGRQSAHAPRDEDARIPEDEPREDAKGNGVDMGDDAEDAEAVPTGDATDAPAEAVGDGADRVAFDVATRPSDPTPAAGASAADALGGERPAVDVERARESRERAERPGGDFGAQESASHPKAEKHGPMLVPPANAPRGPVPYAPGARTHMAPQESGGQSGQSGAEPVSRAAGAPARGMRFDRDRDHGEHEPLRPEVRGEVGPLIDSLHDVFVQDRTVASQGGTTRCGLCYLHFPIAELEYRDEEGYYVCARCARALGRTRLPMVRRQQRS